MSEKKRCKDGNGDGVKEKRSALWGLAPALTNAAIVAMEYGSKYARRHQEHFVVIAVNEHNRAVKETVVFKGGISAMTICIPTVLKPVIAAGCKSFIVLHNHPSGDPTPSPDDRMATARLAEAANVLDMKMLDHVIVGDGHFGIL